jgi:uncharacterized protein YjbI with pentapeptide repeats
MRENIRISSYVGIAFLVAFGTLFLFFTMYDEGLLTNTDIQEVKVGVNNKIFLLGTSYVGAINSDHVQNVLDENGFSTSVLNPTSQLISQTLEIVDDIISNNPKLIVYGIGFRDIGFTDYGFCKLSQIPPYNLSKYTLPPDVSDISNKEKVVDTDIFSQNPKHVTLDVLENILGKQKILYLNDQHTDKKNIELNIFESNKIDHIDNLNKNDPSSYCMKFDIRDKELDSLDIMFAEFYENDINVITFIPPYTASYLNKLDPTLKLDLSSNIELISKKYNFEFYDLSSEFKNENIFSNHSHVAKDPNSLIYSERIASLITPSLLSDYTSYDISDNIFSRQDLSEMNFQRVNLSGKDLQGKDFSNSNLFRVNLLDTDLSSADLSNTVLAFTDLTRTNLENTILVGADLSNTILANVDLSGKDLSNTILANVDLSGKDLSNTILVGADLSNTILANVDLSGKDLSNTILANVDLSGKDLSNTILANVDLSGKDLSNTILVGADLTNTILVGADLSNTILANVDLSGKDLSNTNFSGSTLTNVKLIKVDGSNSDFSSTVMTNVEMTQSNFSSTNFSSTVMTNVEMTQSNFSSTNFSNSTILNLKSVGTIISNSDFSYSQILDSNIKGSHLDHSDLSHMKFSNSNLFGVNLSNSKMNYAMMESTNIKNTNFEYTILDNSKFVDVTMNCINHIICE